MIQDNEPIFPYLTLKGFEEELEYAVKEKISLTFSPESCNLILKLLRIEKEKK